MIGLLKYMTWVNLTGIYTTEISTL